MQDYHKLKVWEKSHALAIDVHRIAGGFPRVDGIALTGQLRRAALSIPSNIAEGSGKSGNSEFRRFLNIALGSAVETDYHLLAARDLGLLEVATYEELAARTMEVRRMLGGLIKKVSETLDAGMKPESRKGSPITSH
jgi:four helix bundle protein